MFRWLMLLPLLITLITACGGSDDDDPTATTGSAAEPTATTAATQAGAATATEAPAEPTATTPAPTATTAPEPTATTLPPTATTAPPTETPEPTATATSEPAPEPVALSGTGSGLSQTFPLTAGLYVVSSTHTAGTSNVIGQLLNQSTGENVGLLVNEIGEYSGSIVINVREDGDYVAEVNADGAWTITIAPPSQDVLPEPYSFQGSGNQVIGYIDMSQGIHRTTATHDGESNFFVYVYQTEGFTAGFGQLVFNEIGVFTGEAAIQVTESQLMLLAVEGDGNWTITVE